MTYGGIEAGGTKWVCAIGSGPADIREVVTFPTTSPDETIGRATEFFAGSERIAALGIGSFGPVDLRRTSPTFGYITTTPKPGWRNTDLAGALARSLDVPVAIDTDVNAAAVAEHRWGAAVGLDSVYYVTVGTGIGGGGIVNGKPTHGLLHPEFGHMRIPHDRDADPFAGVCPYHGDCLEGLASGEAISRRWGVAGEKATDERVWSLEARYLALGLVNVICALCPERLVIGGGVMQHEPLLPLVRALVKDLLAGYIDVPELAAGLDDYLVAPALGNRSGVIGALALASDAAGR